MTYSDRNFNTDLNRDNVSTGIKGVHLHKTITNGKEYENYVVKVGEKYIGSRTTLEAARGLRDITLGC